MFTIEQIRNYILSQDSLGDVLYNLSKENIIKANPEDEDSGDFDEDIAQKVFENYDFNPNN